jgi:ribonucleoside-diphosphate reductase alpha chain
MLNRISISSSKAEGIGLAVSNIRSKETNVGNSNGKSGGILKYLKIVNEALRFWNQRGKRPGSCAVYIEPWHKDIYDVLDIRKKTGDENLRARDLFSALWIPNNFMKAVEENGDWYLFCPHDIKKAGLKPFYEIYGKEYEEEYNKAVEMGLGTKIKAHDLWLKIIESQIETGMPYMCFKDHANEKSNQKNMGVIHSSNLCSEIIQVTDAKTTAICTLTSIPVQKFVINSEYNFEELGRVTRSITKSLNIAIDVNEYSTKEGRKGGLEQRALGIGIQGLADTFAMLKLPFTSHEARLLNKNIFETIYFNALKQSCDLAKETGLTYHFYEGSPISQGIFQWEMWGVKEEELSGLFDWSQLREDIKKYGVRNSLVTTCPPTASSARVIGSNEAFEPFTSNLYVRKVTGGEFAMVNKHLVKDLENEGLWNRTILNELIKNDGSVQNIPVVSQELKDRYKTVWEMSQKSLIEMSAERAPFVDQSQSLNIFFDTPTVGKLTTSHTLAWKLGLKTGQYYLRSQPVEMKAKHLAIDTAKQSEPQKPKDSQFECFGCSA